MDKSVPLEKDLKVVAYLKSEEATLLRESYISYLISEDFILLNNMGNADALKILPKLKSVTELASLEGDENDVLSLFSQDGLSRFSPKCRSVEYFFTGMFVNNLLWDKQPLDS